MTKNEKIVKGCLDFIRREMAKASGEEIDVLRLFCDQIGSEVEGWEMRIQELEDPSDD